MGARLSQLKNTALLWLLGKPTGASMFDKTLETISANIFSAKAFSISVVLALAGCTTPNLEQADTTPDMSVGFAPEALADDERLDKFAAYAPQSRYTIQHDPWQQFLSAAVFDLGPSTRQKARTRKGGVHTGTRISTGSRSAVRFEGNRVMFHLFNDDTIKFIESYRDEMVGLMDRYAYSDFGRDEQLAYWLNLHNAILVLEIAKIHPISRPRTHRLRSHNNTRLFDAKLVVVAGEPLSLNDIRHKIVYANWEKQEVIYGMWDGTIGGVDIMPSAFTGDNVWSLLGSNANRYVNSLRGVQAFPGSFGRIEFRISSNYFEARRMFPEWPNDLYGHLDKYANASVARLLQTPPRLLRILPYDSSTADFSGGEVARFGGNDNAAAVLSLKPDDASGLDGPVEDRSSGTPTSILENFGAPVLNRTMRGGVSTEGFELKEREMEQRRLRRRDSDVEIEDIDNPDSNVIEATPTDEAEEVEPNDTGS